MLLTERKRSRGVLAAVLDYLAVWRFVHERCFSCGWEGDGLVPFDLDDFPRNRVSCLKCDQHTARVVGIVTDLPALPLTEARRVWAEKHADGWEPEFLPLIAQVGTEPVCQRGVLYLT